MASNNAKPLPLGLNGGRPSDTVTPSVVVGRLGRAARVFAGHIGLGLVARRGASVDPDPLTGDLPVRPPVDYWPGGEADSGRDDRVRTGDPAYDRLVNQRRANAVKPGAPSRIGRGLPSSVHRRGRTVAGPRTAPGAGRLRPAEVKTAPNEATKLAPSSSAVPAAAPPATTGDDLAALRAAMASQKGQGGSGRTEPVTPPETPAAPSDAATPQSTPGRTTSTTGDDAQASRRPNSEPTARPGRSLNTRSTANRSLPLGTRPGGYLDRARGARSMTAAAPESLVPPADAAVRPGPVVVGAARQQQTRQADRAASHSPSVDGLGPPTIERPGSTLPGSRASSRPRSIAGPIPDNQTSTVESSDDRAGSVAATQAHRGNDNGHHPAGPDPASTPTTPVTSPLQRALSQVERTAPPSSPSGVDVGHDSHLTALPVGLAPRTLAPLPSATSGAAVAPSVVAGPSAPGAAAPNPAVRGSADRRPGEKPRSDEAPTAAGSSDRVTGQSPLSSSAADLTAAAEKAAIAVVDRRHPSTAGAGPQASRSTESPMSSDRPTAPVAAIADGSESPGRGPDGSDDNSNSNSNDRGGPGHDLSEGPVKGQGPAASLAPAERPLPGRTVEVVSQASSPLGTNAQLERAIDPDRPDPDPVASATAGLPVRADRALDRTGATDADSLSADQAAQRSGRRQRRGDGAVLDGNPVPPGRRAADRESGATTSGRRSEDPQPGSVGGPAPTTETSTTTRAGTTTTRAGTADTAHRSQPAAATTPNQPSVAGPDSDLGSRFLAELRRDGADRPGRMPGQFRTLARAIAGTAAVDLVTGPATRRALASVGKQAATIGRSIYLAGVPDNSVRQHEIIGHELTHVARPSLLPRFFDDDRHSPEERLAESVGRQLGADRRRGTAPTIETLGRAAGTLPTAATPPYPARSPSSFDLSSFDLSAASGRRAPQGPAGPIAGSQAHPAPATTIRSASELARATFATAPGASPPLSSPSSVVPSQTTPTTTAPGTTTPGTATPGTATPGTATPGTATPGRVSAAPRSGAALPHQAGTLKAAGEQAPLSPLGPVGPPTGSVIHRTASTGIPADTALHRAVNGGSAQAPPTRHPGSRPGPRSPGTAGLAVAGPFAAATGGRGPGSGPSLARSSATGAVGLSPAPATDNSGSGTDSGRRPAPTASQGGSTSSSASSGSGHQPHISRSAPPTAAAGPVSARSSDSSSANNNQNENENENGGAEPPADSSLGDIDRLIEVLEERILHELERRGARFRGGF